MPQIYVYDTPRQVPREAFADHWSVSQSAIV